jgi:hypothetical protein
VTEEEDEDDGVASVAIRESLEVVVGDEEYGAATDLNRRGAVLREGLGKTSNTRLAIPILSLLFFLGFFFFFKINPELFFSLLFVFLSDPELFGIYFCWASDH